jgi:hypothetical protein
MPQGLSTTVQIESLDEKFLRLSKKENFGQPFTVIALPKAQIISKLCSFWPTSGPKTALNEDFGAFDRVIAVLGCPNFLFWTAPYST